MPGGTLRAIEAGTRRLSQEDEARIADRLGAVWVERKNAWFCATDLSVPYSREFFELYTQALTVGADQFECDRDAMMQALSALMEALPVEAYRTDLLAIHRYLLSLAKFEGLPPDVVEFIESQRPIRIHTLPQKRKEAK